jgi:cytochrome P450 family 33
MIFPAILIALVLALCFYNFYYKRRNLPPGPIPFPVIGNIPALFSAKRFEYKFLEWKKKYGPIYTYWLGEIPVIAVTDAKLATQIFVKGSFLSLVKFHK